MLELQYTLPPLNFSKSSNQSVLAQNLVNVTGVDISAITSSSIKLAVSLSFGEKAINLLDGPLPPISVDVNVNASSINLATVTLREGLEVNQVLNSILLRVYLSF